MRPASAFRLDTPRFPSGERWEPLVPQGVAPTQLRFHLEGGEQCGDASCLRQRFRFLFPGLLMVWHYCGGGRVLSTNAFEKQGNFIQGSLAL